MARVIEATGKDVGEATARALAKFGIARDEADIEVINRGRKGFLWLFKGTPARVAVSQRTSSRERAEELVADMLRLMRLSCQPTAAPRRARMTLICSGVRFCGHSCVG